MKKCTKCLVEKEVQYFSFGKAYKDGLRSWCKSCTNLSCIGKYKKPYPREKKIWVAMKYRCDNKKCPFYKDYGGRGISYDPKWVTFQGFWEDMSYGYEKNLTLDRIDNNGSYSKENCRWATQKEQNRNTRANVMCTLHGQTRALSEWAELYGVYYPLVRDRVRRQGWDLLKALTVPKQKRKRS